MFVMSQPHDSFNYGITVTKKIGNAVTRNRSRRLIREVVRQVLRQMKNGTSVVFVVKKSMVGRPYSEITADLQFAFKKADILQARPHVK